MSEFRVHTLTGGGRDGHEFDHWDTCPKCRAVFDTLKTEIPKLFEDRQSVRPPGPPSPSA